MWRWLDSLMTEHEQLVISLISAATAFGVIFVQNCFQLRQLKHIRRHQVESSLKQPLP